MKEYRVILERTVRAVRRIEAESDKEAMELARAMHLQTPDSQYEDGESDSEYDYALIDDCGHKLISFGH